MYRLAERLRYPHVSDLLREMHAAELTGWFEYLALDDEVRANLMTYAIVKAFQKPETKQQQQEDDDDDEPIDTTSPEFAQNFEGFITK